MNRRGKLLDTNIVIALLERDMSLRWRIGHDFLCYLPVPVLGELFGGAQTSARPAQNLANFRRVATEIPVVACDWETAEFYGSIDGSLRKKGKPIPQNDVWIAALALQHNMDLITRDKHFNLVQGLNVETW